MKVSRKPWLTRWYLIRTPWFGVKLHRIRKYVTPWHTHPWNGFSLILGNYLEQRERGRWQKVWFFNSIKAFSEHRTYGNTWTLFIHGPRVNEKWYWGTNTAPWRGPQDG